MFEGVPINETEVTNEEFPRTFFLKIILKKPTQRE